MTIREIFAQLNCNNLGADYVNIIGMLDPDDNLAVLAEPR